MISGVSPAVPGSSTETTTQLHASIIVQKVTSPTMSLGTAHSGARKDGLLRPSITLVSSHVPLITTAGTKNALLSVPTTPTSGTITLPGSVSVSAHPTPIPSQITLQCHASIAVRLTGTPTLPLVHVHRR